MPTMYLTDLSLCGWHCVQLALCVAETACGWDCVWLRLCVAETVCGWDCVWLAMRLCVAGDETVCGWHWDNVWLALRLCVAGTETVQLALCTAGTVCGWDWVWLRLCVAGGCAVGRRGSVVGKCWAACWSCLWVERSCVRSRVLRWARLKTVCWVGLCVSGAVCVRERVCARARLCAYQVSSSLSALAHWVCCWYLSPYRL